MSSEISFGVYTPHHFRGKAVETSIYQPRRSIGVNGSIRVALPLTITRRTKQQPKLLKPDQRPKRNILAGKYSERFESFAAPLRFRR